MNKKIVLYICFFFILGTLLIFALVTLDKRIEKNSIFINDNMTNETLEPINKMNGDFVQNQIMISFDKKYSEEEIKNTISSIRELKQSKILFDKSYILTLNKEFKSRTELYNYCKELVNNTIITNCEANNIIRLDDCSKGPC